MSTAISSSAPVRLLSGLRCKRTLVEERSSQSSRSDTGCGFLRQHHTAPQYLATTPQRKAVGLTKSCLELWPRRKIHGMQEGHARYQARASSNA